MRRAVQTRIIPALIRVLRAKDNHPEVRSATLLALGHVHVFDTVEMMRKMSREQSNGELIQLAAVTSLRLMRGEPGIPERDAVEIWLNDMGRDKRLPEPIRAAAEFACSTPQMRSAPFAASDAATARWVLRAARRKLELEIPIILAGLTEAMTPPLTRKACAVAGGLLTPLAVPVIRRRIVDQLRAIVRDARQDMELRTLACLALANARTLASRLDLLAFAQSDNLAIQTAALLAAGRRLLDFDAEQRRQLTARARALASGPEPSEYRSLIGICRALHADRTAIPELLPRVAHEPHASLALGLLMDTRQPVLTALHAAARTSRIAAVRQGAAMALTMLRENSHKDALVKQLRQSTSFFDQATLVATLGRIRARAAIDPLIGILLDPKRTAALRALAARALGHIGDFRSRSTFEDDACAFVPGLDEPLVDAWLAQR